MLEHKHLILKGEIRRPESCEAVEASLSSIVRLVNMKVLLPPKAVYCAEPGNAGHTGIILLTTSHMTWHDWDGDEGKPSKFQFDLYSCADFDPCAVADYLEKNHKLNQSIWKLFDRNYDLLEVHSGSLFS